MGEKISSSLAVYSIQIVAHYPELQNCEGEKNISPPNISTIATVNRKLVRTFTYYITQPTL
jgi:hypothetical protein